MKCIWAVVVVVLSCFPSVLAQQQIRVDLGNNVALVGEMCEIHLSLDTRDREIATVETDIGFFPVLSFTGAAIADGMDSSSFKITSEVVPGQSTQQTVKLRIQAAEGGSLPEGDIVVLKFQVSEEIDDEEVLEVRLENKSIAIDPSGAQMETAGGAGSITVMAAPPAVVACFFFMH